jgi:hypothetical protein
LARFRLFGRAPAQPPSAASGTFDPPAVPPYGSPPSWPPGPPPIGAGAPWPAAGPATRAARPAVRSSDPPTDPHGFSPVPGAHRPGPPLPTPWPAPSSWPAPAAIEAPEPSEAAALAGAFAVDYLSWDEEDPARRGRVLRDYLTVPGNNPAHLGWSGQGRQRAEFALPGRVRPDGEGRVLVDVRVRVTPYRAVGEHEARGAALEAEPDITGVPAVAPAPTGRGWRSLASCWIRLSVPVVLEGGRLVVDAWEETLGDEEPPPATPAAPATPADDLTLADDDPLSETRKGDAW